jgi:hypothetical protein
MNKVSIAYYQLNGIPKILPTGITAGSKKLISLRLEALWCIEQQI